MRIRESGMPEEAYWESFFEPDAALSELGCDSSRRNVVEFGCGYGTFTIAAARLASGKIYALDIDPVMVAATRKRAADEGADHVEVCERDFVSVGTGLPDGSCGYAMLFNILHLEDPVSLLKEAGRVLDDDGLVGIMHWRYDPSTPRGPSMAIRPRPEQCLEWTAAAGFRVEKYVERLECCPFHYGIVGRRAG